MCNLDLGGRRRRRGVYRHRLPAKCFSLILPRIFTIAAGEPVDCSDVGCVIRRIQEGALEGEDYIDVNPRTRFLGTNLHHHREPRE